MYFTNILILIIASPLLAYFLISVLKRRIFVIIFTLIWVIGLIFTFISTKYKITFENNLIDVIIIQLFITSLYALMYMLFKFYNYIKRSIKVLIHITLSISMFVLFINSFGPSESCGKRFPQQINYLEQNLKITHAGHIYGFMDYGSRFIIYKIECNELERIIGYAENNYQFYGNKCHVKLDLESKILKINYIDFNKNELVDSLYIQLTNN